jgi:glycosyltransferase involved in cell wall biosynthesis
LITFVSYAGDYREAFQRLSSGGPETYQAQRYSIDFVGSLNGATVICAICPEPYNVVLANGVRAIGAGLKPGFDARDLVPFLEGTSRLILTTPMVHLLAWAHRNKVRTITALADSFPSKGLRNRIRNRRLARHLNRAEWVANHQLPACRSLVEIGVNPDKIIPWDWPPSHHPRDYAPRTLAGRKLLYVGSVCKAKGVVDLIRAVPENVSLTVVGPLLEAMPERPNVTFAGIVPNDQIPAMMREADCVVIPSRHEYPEGLPLTIYEALASRTPIIQSDHPMFPNVGLKFPAGDVPALRSAIESLLSDSRLYADLSFNSLAAWEALQIPVTYGELITHWLADDNEWLALRCVEARENGERMQRSSGG